MIAEHEDRDPGIEDPVGVERAGGFRTANMEERGERKENIRGPDRERAVVMTRDVAGRGVADMTSAGRSHGDPADRDTGAGS